MVSKEDIYTTLSEVHDWTPEEISMMNPHQQMVYWNHIQRGGSKIQSVNSLEEVNAIRARAGKPPL